MMGPGFSDTKFKDFPGSNVLKFKIQRGLVWERRLSIVYVLNILYILETQIKVNFCYNSFYNGS